LIAAAITDEFQPTVTWFCSEEGGFDLTLTTSQPFFGSLHAMDRYQSCRINGTGRKQLHYYIAFTNTQECNVKYDKKNDLYSIQMEVNEHPVLILQQDRIFDLICAGGKIDVTNKSDTIAQHNASQHLSRVCVIKFHLILNDSISILTQSKFKD
uniref:ZP domain-containing protein n=1 Tax=Anisakis simplex TaxID=6269 RepID=A0A0M3JCX1_ANISI